ncbi:Phosphatidic acid phosphatase type 2/haloperoxidase [Botryosphaeria dothidea]|uniref:Phosphatidic acid phosphatase type 2/haloperoxidase n=1 Tax=Botryosphaeria dothidea TaxID=55169 RepID=A0A8H4N272_9PEZI|nr:Phosphatidic acid phosphatase type 2/haloperoxidase [Botryosphaeria dothidea]
MTIAEDDQPRYDAGNRALVHYQSKLPVWRYRLRCFLIPIVRWETPYLAYMQDALRTPALDSYFAFTANLGTHTFFMIMLPILFWCGYTNLGKAMVHVLASGVFWSGFVKDMLCLPRPLSPPLQRITMSGSAALEYGFPSTHSTNAVSVAVYAIWMLRTSDDASASTTHTALQAALYFYAISIVFGRLYCGMHGFFDVVVGTTLGALIAGTEILWGNAFDHWVCQESFTAPLIVTLVILILVRIHPEPADDCPCFDDSVCFAGVVIGVEVGIWHFAKTRWAYDDPVPGTVAFDIEQIGWLKAALRIVLGVFIIFAWRGLMKPTLLKVLPPIFRILERSRMNLPRKFFLEASKYTSIANLRDDDHVIPSASEIPSKLTNLRHPRKRTVSIGPQSMADAYETLAYRHQRRRESLNSLDAERPRSPIDEKQDEYLSPEQANADAATSTSSNTLGAPAGANLLPTPMSSRVHSYEQMMGAGSPSETAATSPITPAESDGGAGLPQIQPLDTMADEETEDREIFSKLERPRVRYDVEVVTKLIVYSGIAWLAVEGNPVLFELFGLGMR